MEDRWEANQPKWGLIEVGPPLEELPVRLLPRCTVGSRQAEHESQGESMEEDDMVMGVGMAIPCTETNR